MRKNQKAVGGGDGTRSDSRPTIGLFIESTAGRGAWYQTAVWAGVADAARELDANLLSFAGGALVESPFNEFEVQRNLLYDLVTQGSVDGLIISVSLGSYASWERFKGFCNRYRFFLPMVSIGVRLPDIPHVLVNNKKGIREAVRHLIAEHNRRRIAFIRGPADNPEAKARYKAYRETLVEFDLFDRGLVVPGDFEPESGSKAIDMLLDQRQVAFDAVLAANDYMALGALKRLKARGRRVPDDVAVVGFDGVEEGEAFTPPLTTVRQPVHQQAKQAVEMLLGLLAGKQVPPQVILPTELGVRESCGCMASEVTKAQAELVNKRRTPGETLTVEWESILPEMMQTAGIPPTGMDLERMRVLLDAFSDELKGESPGIFLTMLYGLLCQAAEGGDVAAWQDAISVLRRKMLACLGDGEALARAEDLCHQARVMIAQVTQQVEAQRRVQVEQQAVLLREIGDKLITTVEAKGLMDVVADGLPRLGIPSCYISLYEPDFGKAAVRSDGLPGQATKAGATAPVNSRLILAYDEGERCREAEGQVFPSRQLVPGGVLDHQRHYSMVVEALHFRKDQLGFALFEMGPRDGVIYEALRGQISSALKGALLVQQVEQGQELLRSLYEASGSIISLKDPDRILQDIVEKARDAVGGWRANLVLLDQEGNPRRLARVGFERDFDIDTSIRPTGVSVQVVRTGKPVLIEDVQNAPGLAHPGMVADGVGAAACIPFHLRGRLMGVMWVHYREPRRFSKDEVDALRLYANQAAIAYDNARRMRELEHLHQAVEKLASVTEVQPVLQQIAASAQEVLEAASAVIWSYDADRGTFLPAELVAAGVEPQVLERFREDEPRPGGTAAMVIRKGYLAVTDVDDPRYADLGPVASGLRGTIGVKSFQGIALQADGEPLGVLYVNHRLPQWFDEEDESTLEAFAYHAALALKKARLLEQVRRAHDTARVVATVSVLENLQGTLQAIAGGTQDALNCDIVTLYTYDQAKDEIGFPPAMVGVKDISEVLKFGFVARNSLIRSILGRDKLHVAEDAPSDTTIGGPFVRREGIKSSVSIPLRVGDHKVGVMFVNYCTRHRFTGEEIADIELFAHQAAVAIRNAQLYEEATKRTTYLQALYNAGTAVTSTLALDEILDRLVDQVRLITGRYGKQAHLIHLGLKEGNKLGYKAWSLEPLPGSKEKTGVVDLEHDRPIGIMGRAVKTGQSQLADDATQDKDYLQYDSRTRSELAVPVKLGEEVIGVINVEHPERGVFDEEDRRTLEALATQAALAIRNAQMYAELRQRYHELEQIKGLVGAQTALDWMRMVSTVWGHSIKREVGNALVCTELVRMALAEQEYQKVLKTLDDLEATIEKVKDIPITAPLSAEDAVSSVRVNRIVQGYLSNLWKHAQYNLVDRELELQPDLDDLVTVRASEEWLRRGIEIVVDNAVQAMLSADSNPKRLSVVTHLADDKVEVLICDTGPGISDEIRGKIFKEPIDKPKGSRGAGIGLVLARNIFEAYQGSIAIRETGQSGTVMAISLPVECSKQ